jgi:hypothetical protein
VEPILAIADELERRDADVAQRLAAVERRQHEVDELRAAVEATARKLDALPAHRDAQARDEAAALEARARAAAALREADGAEPPVLEAARSALAAAESWVADARAQRGRLADEERLAVAGAAATARRAEELGAEPRGGGPDPHASLAAAAQWASRERGALLVAHSGLARERDAVVREASELLGSVLGEPMATTSVAGLRGRLQRAL